MRKGAIILCGGKSSRMGRDKATLPFGPELMLQRVVRLIGEAVDPKNIVVVAALNQLLPELPANVLVAHDAQQDRGPLEGLATGFRALSDHSGSTAFDPSSGRGKLAEVDAIYATACDVPLLAPAFVERMFELLGNYEIAVPFDGQHHHPLAAVYRPTVLAHVQRLIDSDRMRPRFLFDEVRTREIPVEDLRAADPQLASLENLNYQQDYFSALAIAGYVSPNS